MQIYADGLPVAGLPECITNNGWILFDAMDHSENLVNRSTKVRGRGYRWWPRGMAVLAPLLAVVLLCRFSAFFLPLPLNPDEAQMLGQAARLDYGAVPWVDIDTTTSGPLNTMVLWLIGKATGLEGFPLARITAFLLYAAIIILGHNLARRLAGERWALLTTVLVTLPVGIVPDFDFLSYSSCLLPTVLLGSATTLALSVPGARHPVPRIVATLFLFSLVPFAKLQGAPIAMALAGAVCVFWHFRRSDLGHRLVTLAVPAGVMGPLVIFAVVAAHGGLGDFWRSYILFGLERTGDVALAQLVFHNTGLAIRESGLLMWTALAMAVCVATLVGLQTRRYRARRMPIEDLKPLLERGLVAIWMVAGIITIIVPGRPYLLYVNFVIIPLQASVAAAGAALWARRPAPRRVTIPRVLVAAAGSIALLGMALAIRAVWRDVEQLQRAQARQGERDSMTCRARVTEDEWRITYNSAVPGLINRLLLRFGRLEDAYRAGQLYDPTAAVIDKLTTPAERITVWGWMAEYHVLSKRAPATRDAITEAMLRQSPLREYYRARFLADLHRDPPAAFVDAVAPGSFLFTDHATLGIESFPLLAKFIADGYIERAEVPNIGGGPPVRVFLRRDLVSRPATPCDVTGSATPARRL